MDTQHQNKNLPFEYQKLFNDCVFAFHLTTISKYFIKLSVLEIKLVNKTNICGNVAYDLGAFQKHLRAHKS